MPMRMVDIIAKKERKLPLSEKEIAYFVKGVTGGSIPDYQITAFLMAVYFTGMNVEETVLLTRYMVNSGDRVDLSSIVGMKVDKHSTGGVGDKTTLIIAPLAAACGVKVGKMSGRGLGHTGGTLDKMESIPGMRVNLSKTEFFDIVNTIGVCVIGQTGNICPADKKMYALRDVTATVQSLPLIASSVMSKKLAAGADCILLDVKVGSGAFMKTKEEAIALAQVMVDIGTAEGRRTGAMITNMDVPLGRNIGNALEVAEAVQTLRGEGPEDLTILSLELAARMIFLAGMGSPEECYTKAKDALYDGRGLAIFEKMVQAQGGDIRVIQNTELLPKAAIVYEVRAEEDGYIGLMDTEACGIAAGMLGAGRETKDSAIDYSAGIVLLKKTGDKVASGDVIALLHTSTYDQVENAEKIFLAGIVYSQKKPIMRPVFMAQVDCEGVKLVPEYGPGGKKL